MVGCGPRVHPTVTWRLAKERIAVNEVVETGVVDVWAFEQLVDRYKIASVDVLKLDCEGCDLDILSSMLECCKLRPGLLPRI